MVGNIIDEDVTRVYFKIAAVFLFLTATILIFIYGTIFYRIKKIHKKNSLVSGKRAFSNFIRISYTVVDEENVGEYMQTLAKSLVIYTEIIL